MIRRLFGLFVFACLMSLPAWAQVQITGTVTDTKGETVIGASVLVKGTTNGTITDFDGNFILSNVAKDATVQVSYIGYKTEEFKLGGNPFPRYFE